MEQRKHRVFADLDDCLFMFTETWAGWNSGIFMEQLIVDVAEALAIVQLDK
jgi:hypothetical protein